MSKENFYIVSNGGTEKILHSVMRSEKPEGFEVAVYSKSEESACIGVAL